MIVRSLFASLVLAGVTIAGSSSAQVLLCPSPATFSADRAEMRSQAKTLIKRLLISLDLYRNEDVSEDAIFRAHADTPNALLAKLGNVADRCSFAATDELSEFHADLPELRRLFLEAVQSDSPAATEGAPNGSDADLELDEALAGLTEVVASQQAADLSVRALWRKLWFRSPSDNKNPEDRWAVIVASPEGADEGWTALGEHQKKWDDVYFQLHQPYYENSDYHAIIVGKKLPRDEAERLVRYVIEMGMADDSYVWPVPIDHSVNVASRDVQASDAQWESSRKRLDLSVLSD